MKQIVILCLLAIIMVVPHAFAQPEALHSPFDTVLKSFVVDGSVDYAGLRKQRGQLDAYLESLARVREKEFDAWPRDTRLAYLINLYNAATLQLIVDHYPVKSIKDIGSFFRGPWDQKVVRLFAKTITLDNLEHDIIRKQYNEPRIHMALVCAAKGCPPLRGEAYTGRKLDSQLDDQSKVYLASAHGMRLERSSGKVYLSSVFKWYGEDFPSVTKFVGKYTNQNLDGLTVRWLDYDWSLNEM